MITRTVSIRLTDELIKRFYEKCNKQGCGRNDFVKNAIIDSLKEKPKPVVSWTMYDDDGNVIGRSKPENS